jgi:hypothetical protein
MKKRDHTKIHFPLFMFVPPLDESRLEEIDRNLLQSAQNSLARKKGGSKMNGLASHCSKGNPLP